MKKFVAQVNSRVGTRRNREGWIDAVAFQPDKPAEAVRVFVNAVKTKGDFVAQRLGKVASHAPVTIRAALKRKLSQSGKLRLFADAINHATPAAASKDHRVWSLERFNAIRSEEHTSELQSRFGISYA